MLRVADRIIRVQKMETNFSEITWATEGISGRILASSLNDGPARELESAKEQDCRGRSIREARAPSAGVAVLQLFSFVCYLAGVGGGGWYLSLCVSVLD